MNIIPLDHFKIKTIAFSSDSMKSSPKVSEFSPSRLPTADATSGSEWETDDDDDNREKFKPEVSI